MGSSLFNFGHCVLRDQRCHEAQLGSRNQDKVEKQADPTRIFGPNVDPVVRVLAVLFRQEEASCLDSLERTNGPLTAPAEAQS